MIIILYKQLRLSGPVYSFRPFEYQGIRDIKLEIDINETEFDELCNNCDKSIEELCVALNIFHNQKLKKEMLIKCRLKFDTEVNKIKARFKEES